VTRRPADDLGDVIVTTPGPSDSSAISPELLTLLDRPNFVHLATIGPEGAPKLDPVWVDVVDDHTLRIGTARSSIKARNVVRDPRVALSVLDNDHPYVEGQLHGTAVLVDDTDLAIMDAISVKYTGAPFPFRDDLEDRVVMVVTVTRSRYHVVPLEHTPPAA
jgi:PPOX class probable F420-dependent enzyme